MTELSKIMEGLNLFNEKADKLFRLSFVKTMFESNTGMSLSVKSQDDGTYEVSTKRRGPDEEAIDAFVLTYRFFIQKNEKSSFPKLSDYYNSNYVDDKLSTEFNTARQRINDFLDNPADMRINFNDEELTRRIIMETFIYGGLSHSNDPDKKSMYDMWMNMGFFKPIIENEFVYILASIFRTIHLIKDLNVRTLNLLQNENITS